MNRLAIVLSLENCNQISFISKMDNGIGEVEANVVMGALEEWMLYDKVMASGFDTTSLSYSNFLGDRSSDCPVVITYLNFFSGLPSRQSLVIRNPPTSPYPRSSMNLLSGTPLTYPTSSIQPSLFPSSL